MSSLSGALARPRALIRSDAVQRLLAFGALVVLIIVFSLLSSNFLTFDNTIGILLATSVNGILALGVTFVIITGGIDLSIGTVMTLAAVITGVVVTNMGLPIPVGVAAGMLTGGLAGLVNGVLIARFRIPSFIVTLGMLNIAKGLALVISGLSPIYFNDTPEFNQGAMGSLVGSVVPGLDTPTSSCHVRRRAQVPLRPVPDVLWRYTFALGATRRLHDCPESTS
jgi:ribose transport system permease protein